MVRGWIVGLLAALALTLAGAPAVAHSDLESSDPQDGATLASAPAAISFVFNEEILPQGNAVTLTDVAADERLPVGPVDVDGDTVSVTWPGASPAGEFRAAFRVVSADGHPISGTITFTVEQAVGADPATGSAASSAAPSAAPSATPSSGGTVAPGTTSGTATVESDSGMQVWAVGIGVAALVAMGVAVWNRRRAR
jgi:methionine-rich copper-binding protein CopC